MYNVIVEYAEKFRQESEKERFAIMNIVSWIHLSDLHLSDVRATDTLLMRKQLPAYIAGLNEQFDYIFCTGDIKEWDGEYTPDIEKCA